MRRTRAAWAFAPMGVDPRWLGGVEIAALCGLPLYGYKAIWAVVVDSQETVMLPAVSFKRTARLWNCGKRQHGLQHHA